MSLSPPRRAALAVLLAAALFTVLGLIVIPLAGIQNDEALFASQIFTGGYPPFSLVLFGHHPPLMVFAYTGALKTYLYWPIFKLFAPGPYSLRIPVLLAGTITILLFYYFARRIAGERAALFAAVLLASDATFLLSNTFDWGPVALQHLLPTAGLCLIVSGNVTAACFVFGLALWEKSVFIWSIAGLLAGGLAAYSKEIRAYFAAAGTFDKRKAAYAALAFLIGASPLIAYNLKSKNETIRSTAHFSLDHFPLKVEELSLALNGGGLFHFIAAEDWETPHPKPAASLHARIAQAIHNVSGDVRSSLFLYAAALAVPILLLMPGPFRKPALFAAVFSVVTFASMAVTRDAGAAIHHTVLLWPMPQLLVGMALAMLPWRWLSIGLAAVLAGSNLLVINQYIFQLDRNGADGGFTDALYALSDRLPVAPDDEIYITDWGMIESLTLLHRGKLHLISASDPFQSTTPDQGQLEMTAKLLADPHGLFLGHVPDREVFTGVRQRLEDAAKAAGYRKQMLAVAPDSNGRPVFEVFRFEK